MLIISIKNESIHFWSHFYKNKKCLSIFKCNKYFCFRRNVSNVIFHLYPYEM